MSEADAIAKSQEPATIGSLAADLVALGVKAGDVVLVHSSLSALGWICGGPAAIIEALLAVLGPGGTLVMPAHSSDLSEPSKWGHPPVPQSWCPAIRANMPAFDPRRTPTRGMGAVAELFRTWPGALRSDHPTVSMAALGPRAGELLSQHPLDDGLGEASPLGRLYDLNAKVLLLGVGHDRNTSLHLAERKAFGDRQEGEPAGSPILQDGTRRWVEYVQPAVNSDDFEALGAAFEVAPKRVTLGKLGAGSGRQMDQRELVDFGVEWLVRHRDAEGRCETPFSPDGPSTATGPTAL
jgi:aminoglycoside 3-N-acetyltransferase